MFHYFHSMVMMFYDKERTLTIWINPAPSHHIVVDTMSQEKNLLLLIYFRAQIYSVELHHSNECFYLMKTSFTRITISRCPWYMRIKRQSPSNIFFTIFIYFLAHKSLTKVKTLTTSISISDEYDRYIKENFLCVFLYRRMNSFGERPFL